MKNLEVEIITPSKPFFKGEVTSITIPGSSGSFQVFKSHAPLISTFEVGAVSIENLDGTKSLYATSGGSVEVLDNKVLMLAESIENSSEINVNRAEEAAERAKNRLSHKDEEEVDVTRAEASLARAMNRIKIAKNLM